MRRVDGAAPPLTLAVHPALRRVFLDFERRNVRWALLWVPEGGLFRPRGDVDLVIDPSDAERAGLVLAVHGFVRVPRRGADLHYLQYSAATDQWLWIHAVTTLGFGPAHPLPIGGERGVLACRRFTGDVPQLKADTAFWLLLWHGLETKRQLADRHRVALTELMTGADTGSNVARIFAAACAGPRALTWRLIEAVRRRDWNTVEAQVTAGVQAAAQARRRRLGARVLRAAVRVMDAGWRWRECRGLTVALLGPDGSGKTTLADGIRASVPLPSLFMYMGLTGGALVYAHRLRIPGLVFGVSVAIIWRRYLRSLYHRARGRLVVIDRYVYDAVTPHQRHQRWWQRAARSLMGRICPGPDLVLLLDAPGTVMFNRKYEYSPATLEDWRQRFRSLTGRLPRLEVIDASRDAEAVRIDAVARIWKRYAERWGGRPPDRSSREVVARP